ncbi:hypothetical protein [uncultured Chitinophaga sp.]|jgi:hypothetical protein|uniref:hypothetical protein n=1 Tax=uncultured Chitinophaga sp. TaxID=339340 RepID=UPI00261A0949|nr:hypothetical protein [uncultured Chitinophaga sp.]
MKKRIIHFFVLSCKKASGLIEKNLYFKLSLPERIQLRWHLTLCDACSTYKKQSGLLHDLLSRHEHDHTQAPPLPEDATQELKEKIIRKLEH